LLRLNNGGKNPEGVKGGIMGLHLKLKQDGSYEVSDSGSKAVLMRLEFYGDALRLAAPTREQLFYKAAGSFLDRYGDMLDDEAEAKPKKGRDKATNA
jgi:hypothetical protein